MNVAAELAIQKCIDTKSGYLNLSRLELGNLNLPVDELRNVYSLNLSNNKLKELPDDIAKLENLTNLFVDNNNLSIIQENIGSLAKLNSISIANNNITGFPNFLLNLKEMTEINISGNIINFLPERICELTNLRVIVAEKSNLFELPNDIGLLRELQSLILPYNSLKKLPESFCELRRMTLLKLSNNKINRLPNDFCNLTALKVLELDGNSLECLPDNIGKLSDLEYLKLGENGLTKLPVSLRLLEKIDFLDIDKNKIEYVSDIINSLPEHTIKLEIRNNPFVENDKFNKNGLIKLWEDTPPYIREVLSIYFSAFKLYYFEKTSQNVSFSVENQVDGLVFKLKLTSDVDFDELEKLLNYYFKSLQDSIRGYVSFNRKYTSTTDDKADLIIQNQVFSFYNSINYVRTKVGDYVTDKEVLGNILGHLNEMNDEFEDMVNGRFRDQKKLLGEELEKVRLLERSANYKEELDYRRGEAVIRANSQNSFTINQQVNLDLRFGDSFYDLRNLLDGKLSTFQKEQAKEIGEEIDSISKAGGSSEKKGKLATKLKRWLNGAKEAVKVSKEVEEVGGEVVKQLGRLQEFANSVLNDSELADLIVELLN